MFPALENFISKSLIGGKHYTISPLPHDASHRRYFRIILPGMSYIVMSFDIALFNPKDFIYITGLLGNHDIHCPKIIDSNLNEGMILLEDLGNISLKDYILKSKRETKAIYEDAIKLLVALQDIPNKSLANIYSQEDQLSGIKLFLKFFPRYIAINTIEQIQQPFIDDCKQIFKNYSVKNLSFVHRDYHVENIMLYNHSLSLIDYQDASIGSPLYDLVSIAQDARIYVEEALEQSVIESYCNKKNLLLENIIDEYNILGFQRNLRILGVFTYQYIVNGNKKYLRYIPRVIEYLKRNLRNPILHKINQHMLHIIT